MSANFCPNCGASLQAGTRFCPNCGQAVDSVQPQNIPPPPAHGGKGAASHNKWHQCPDDALREAYANRRSYAREDEVVIYAEMERRGFLSGSPAYQGDDDGTYTIADKKALWSLLLGIFAILPLGSIAGAMLSNDDFLFDKALPVIGFLRLVALAAGLWMGISAKKAGSKRKTATVGIVLCALGLLWILGRYIQI